MSIQLNQYNHEIQQDETVQHYHLLQFADAFTGNLEVNLETKGQYTLEGKLIITDGVSPYTLPLSNGSEGQYLKSTANGQSIWGDIEQLTINNNASHRVLTSTATTDTIQGETYLTFDGTTLGVNLGASTPTAQLEVKSNSNQTQDILFIRNHEGKGLKMNNDGVLILSSHPILPTAQDGSLSYHNSNLWLGV